MHLLLFFLGTCFASFTLCQAENPNDRTWSRASTCNQCQHPLNFFQLIPIIGYWIQGGRCLHCHFIMPFRYPLAEFLSGIYFVWISIQASSDADPINWICISLLLLYLSLYDLVQLEVPAWGLICLLIICFYRNTLLPYPVPILPSLWVWVILETWVFFRPNTFGGADSKLLAGLSLTLPLHLHAHLIFLSASLGLLWFGIRPKNRRSLPLPFIPCIHLSYLFLLLFV